MNLSITGTLGSGKTSVCNILAENGYNVISNGTIFREIAQEKGLTVVELNKLAETDKSIDKMLDDRSIELGQKLDKTIFDSRMGWHFIPDSFKIFLVADMDEAARRVLNADRVSEKYQTIEEAKKDLIHRQLLEKKRFSSIYNVDYLNLNNYNLIIETTNVAPEVVASKILEYVSKLEKEQCVALLSPTSIYPTKSVSDFDHEKEMESNTPIAITIIDNQFAVVDGHYRLLSHLIGKQALIPCSLCDKDGHTIPEQAALQQYEKLGKFTYPKYPERDTSLAILEV